MEARCGNMDGNGVLMSSLFKANERNRSCTLYVPSLIDLSAFNYQRFVSYYILDEKSQPEVWGLPLI